jgi:hypothetical protein
MMTVPTEIAGKVLDGLKSSPFVLALVVINVMTLVGFGYTLHSISAAMERREPLLRACIERRT